MATEVTTPAHTAGDSNVALIQRFEDSFVGGDIDDVLRILAPDIVVHEADNTPYPGDHIGTDGFLALAEAFNATWEMTAPIGLDIQPAGPDRVLVRVELPVRARPTGRELTLRIAELYTVTDGRIADISVFYWDTAELMHATGGRTILEGRREGPPSALEAARRFEAAVLEDGDFALAMRYADPGLTVREAPGMPYRGTYRGEQGLHELMADVGAVWEFLAGPSITFHASATDPQRVFTRVEGRARLRATGTEYDFLVTEWLTVADGRVRDIEVFYWDQAPAVLAHHTDRSAPYR